MERQYGDRLDEVAEFLADFAAQIKAVGPKTYLESMAYQERDRNRDAGEHLESPPEIAVLDGLNHVNSSRRSTSYEDAYG